MRGSLEGFYYFLNIPGDIQQNVSLAVYDTPMNGDSAVNHLMNVDSTVYHTPMNVEPLVYLTLQSCALINSLKIPSVKYITKW